MGDVGFLWVLWSPPPVSDMYVYVRYDGLASCQGCTCADRVMLQVTLTQDKRWGGASI